MRKEILLFVSLSACVLHAAEVPSQPHPQAVGGMGEARLPPGAGQDWWGKVQADIRAEEYHITWQAPESPAGGSAGYQAPNRAQRFRTWFAEEGIRVEPMTEQEPALREEEAASWTWGLELVAWGRPGALRPAREAAVSAVDNRAEYRRGDLTEWFVNDERGLEQGFTILAPPADSVPGGSTGRVGISPPSSGALPTASGTLHDDCGQLDAGAPLLPSVGNSASPLLPTLHIDLALTGTLRPVISEDGQVVDFYDNGNIAVLRYGSLKVTDATGAVLPSRFEGWCGSVSSSLILHPSSAASGGIRISIDDAGAVYPITVDPLATSPAWTALGENVGDNLGYSVGTAGDVNGDGYADLLVGAPAFSSSTGKAYMFLGSAAGLSSTAAWSGVGQNAGDRFGCVVATAGDVNGDGYSDVLVGAEGVNSYRGRAYLLLGGPSGLTGTPASPAWSATGEAASDSLGTSLSTAGDVNGDGYSDVVVSAYAYGSEAGKVYLYVGGSFGLSTSAIWTATGGAANERFGNCVATAGDVNGDGYADVAVGAAWLGKAYLYLGGASGLPATASWFATGENPYDGFGWTVATAGDVNGDGYSDLAVGATEYNGQRGKVYLYLGGASGLSLTSSWNAVGDGVSSLGCSLGTAGDVNGDGYADLIVGAYAYGLHTGRAYVYLGGATGLSAMVAWTATGVSSTDRFGYSVATAGDVNGDGYSDVVAGAFGFSAGASTGKAYLYLGGSSALSSTASWDRTGESAGDAFGVAVATAGDVNGDGYADVVVGAYAYNSGAGKAYLYLGGASGLSTTASWTTTGENAYDLYGFFATTAGDVNGDGYSDVVVVALRYGDDAGKVYLYLGGASGLSPTAAWTATGETTNINFGHALASAGDVNGDGYADVVAGAASYGGSIGKAYLYLGGVAGLATAPSWTATGEALGDRFGFSAGTAGDVNGDGYADLVVGASDHGGSIGKAYVYLGGPSGLSATASWTADGEGLMHFFGFATATAGDVNGDGYSDVVVGAYGHGGNTGKAYLYLGGAAGLATASSWTATGEAVSDLFGWSVTTAGDVNGDGFSDLVVGAYGYSGSTGKAYLYLGGASGLATTASWTATGEGSGDLFTGYSAGAPGDVNGDGYSDIVVGAHGYNSGTGKTYLYYGNGGAGAAMRPRQLRSDLSAPVAPQGHAYQQKFRIGLTLRSPMGKVWRKMQWQVTPWGGTFAPTVLPIQSDTTWYSNPVDRTVPITLPEDLQRYIWRVRVKYHPAKSPFLLWGPWSTLPANGLFETDVRSTSATAPPACVLPDEPCWLYSVVKNGTDYTLNWQDPNQSNQRTGWNIRRSNDAGLPKNTWPLVGTNVVDMDAGTVNYQWTDHSGADPGPGGVWYYQVTTYNANCSAEGPF